MGDLIGRRSFIAASTLASAMVFTSPAWAATGSPDGSSLMTGQIADEEPKGKPLTMSVQSDADSNPNLASYISIREYSGSNRYGTAASIAKAAFPDGSGSAIIVNGETGWPDALTAACLAPFKGPIVLVNKSEIPSETASALEWLKVKTVVLVGSTQVVGAGIQVALQKMGVAVECRLRGDDRQGTQLDVFNYGLAQGYWSRDLIMLATGNNFPDALAASPVSYALRAPIFVTSADGALSAEQEEAWRAAAQQGYGARVAVLGSEAAVPAAGMEVADQMCKLAGGAGAERVCGDTRYDTSVAIAEWAVRNFGFSWDNAAFSTGSKPWDALAGSVLQGKDKSVLLLADSMGHRSISRLSSLRGTIEKMRFFGSKSALVPSVRMSIADALKFPAAALPNFKIYLDAGHGMNDSGSGIYDSGAVGSGYKEHDLNKELVNKIAPLLKARGVNYYANVDGGPYWLRHAEAISKDCDVILSIHFNAGGGSGSMSMIHEYNDNEYSRKWQSKIHPALINAMGLRDYGQRRQELAILGGKLPAVMLEVCFIDSSYDMATYQSRKNIVAGALANAIMS